MKFAGGWVVTGVSKCDRWRHGVISFGFND